MYPSRHDPDVFDYVIVGAGSAGCLLAERLSQNKDVSICIVEAGKNDWHPYLRLPSGYIKTLNDPRYTWQFKSEPIPSLGGRQISLPQGKVVGGSGSVNGMIFSRGQAEDYDNWAAEGNRGWGYSDVLPYFKRIESWKGPENKTFRGTSGRLPVTITDLKHPLCEKFLQGAEELGLPRNLDYNAATQEGVGYMQRNIWRGWRQSTARVFLKEALKRRDQLTLITEARITRVLFSGNCAKGVEFRRGAELLRVSARREVLICAGAINSPKILLQSGIGPRTHLQDLGIKVLRDLNVGNNLKDHYSVRLVARIKGIKSLNERARGVGLTKEIARWVLGRPSVLAISPALVHWFWRSEENLDRPDIQGVFTPASFQGGVMGLIDKYPGVTIGVNQHRPASSGYVRLRSRDPFDEPVIQPNYLHNSQDQAVIVRGLKFASRLLKSKALEPYLVDANIEGMEEKTTYEEWLQFAKDRGTTSFHLVGTCRMGPVSDPTTVVDDQLRVHGIERLRVIDSSIMPDMPSCNTYAPTLMIAERAFDLIRGTVP